MKQTNIGLVIPLYNEESRISKSLKSILRYKTPSSLRLVRIVFVNDGSTDNTLEVVKSFFRKNKKLASGAKVSILSYKKNRGRGYAVKKGLLYCAGFCDYALYADADLSMSLSNLTKVSSLIKNEYEVIIGSKKKPGAVAIPQRPLTRQIVGYFHTVFASLVLGVFVWDFQGGLKIFSKRFVQNVVPLCKQERWGFDMEVVFLSTKLGYSLYELPAKWKAIEEGTTVKLFRDSRRALFDMLEIRKNWPKLRVMSFNKGVGFARSI